VGLLLGRLSQLVCRVVVVLLLSSHCHRPAHFSERPIYLESASSVRQRRDSGLHTKPLGPSGRKAARDCVPHSAGPKLRLSLKLSLKLTLSLKLKLQTPNWPDLGHKNNNTNNNNGNNDNNNIHIQQIAALPRPFWPTKSTHLGDESCTRQAKLAKLSSSSTTLADCGPFWSGLVGSSLRCISSLASSCDSFVCIFSPLLRARKTVVWLNCRSRTESRPARLGP